MVQDEKQTELCLRILQTCRAELCDLFPYLDAAFDCLRWRFGAETGFSVDGQAMYFPVRETLECYSREPAALRRGYLHMLLHCLFLHLFKPAGEMWDLACDMAVEQMIERQAQPRRQETARNRRKQQNRAVMSTHPSTTTRNSTRPVCFTT